MKKENDLKLDYDEKSPITGNHCVIVEADEDTDITSYMCMESGFTTTDGMKADSEVVKKYEDKITQLMRDTAYIDESRGLVWYPAYLNMPGIGLLYPTGTSRSDMQWEVAAIVNIIGEDREKYPIPGKTDEYYTSRLDVDNAEKFKINEFDSALDYFYSLAAKAYNAQKEALEKEGIKSNAE
jgi:hypothetical protein